MRALNSEDCIFGISLFGHCRKANPIPKQNFVKIIGPAYCEVKKECSNQEKIDIKRNSEFSGWNLFGNLGDCFHNERHLICEPYSGYNGPDFRGTKGHPPKRTHAHTGPSFKVEKAEMICAVCYKATDRQKRRPVKLKEYKLVSST